MYRKCIKVISETSLHSYIVFCGHRSKYSSTLYVMYASSDCSGVTAWISMKFWKAQAPMDFGMHSLPWILECTDYHGFCADGISTKIMR